MNKTIKISLKLLWNHVLFVILTIVFMPIFGWLIKKDNGMLIFSYVVSILYFLMIYSDVWEIARKESKPYSEITPNVIRGLLFGIFASVVSIIMVLLYYLDKIGILDLSIQLGEEPFRIMNFIYRIWMPMFLGFFEAYGETFPAVFGLVVLVLPLASFLGYLAGMHQFSLQDKIVRAFNNGAQKNKE